MFDLTRITVPYPRWVYLAGPMSGLTLEQAGVWRGEATEFLEAHGWIVLDPVVKEVEWDRWGDQTLPSTFAGDTAAVKRDLLDIDQADVVLANFAGAERVSIGSVAELGYAYGKGKVIFTVLDEPNPHDHMFIHRMSTRVLPSLEEALGFLT